MPRDPEGRNKVAGNSETTGLLQAEASAPEGARERPASPRRKRPSKARAPSPSLDVHHPFRQNARTMKLPALAATLLLPTACNRVHLGGERMQHQASLRPTGRSAQETTVIAISTSGTQI
jgi:hypothetical protein